MFGGFLGGSLVIQISLTIWYLGLLSDVTDPSRYLIEVRLVFRVWMHGRSHADTIDV